MLSRGVKEERCEMGLGSGIFPVLGEDFFRLLGRA